MTSTPWNWGSKTKVSSVGEGGGGGGLGYGYFWKNCLNAEVHVTRNKYNCLVPLAGSLIKEML